MSVVETDVMLLSGPEVTAAWIDHPTTGRRAATRGFEVEGWVLGRDGAAAAVEIAVGGSVVWRGPADRPRPDVAAAFPDRPGAARCGFRSPFRGAAQAGELEVRAVLGGGGRVVFARISTRLRDDVELPPEPVVLLYHRVAEARSDPWALAVAPRRFGEHLEVLRRHWRPLRLGELVAATFDGDPPSDAVAVTFDDGYVDFLEQAVPALEQAEVPATVFLPSAQVGRPGAYWWDELAAIVLGPGASEWRAWEPATEERQERYRDLWHELRMLDEEDRERRLRDLRGRPAASDRAAAERCLTADEVGRALRSGLVDVGSHSASHPVLSALPRERQSEEIRRSKTTLEELTGGPVTSFAYPYGRPADLSDVTVELVRAAGYSAAFCNVEASLVRGSDRFRLPRLFVRDWDGEELSRRLRRLSAA